jgi:5-formyltetrahydrofolate cyclo-ligase
MDALAQTKSDLRHTARERLRRMPMAEMEKASAQAREKLTQQSVWREATTIMLYAPLPGELDLLPLLPEAISQGKQIALPRFTVECRYEASLVGGKNDICVGKFGAGEAGSHCSKISLNRLDLVLVPGLAFDSRGDRLGRGKGFYDRLLAEVSGRKCGVALDQQLLSDVPVAPHDILMNYLLTPTRWLTV